MSEPSFPRHAISRHGLVCTSDARASQAGAEALAAGGTCVDAALAAAAVLNVVEPNNSHLGGDAFLIHWSAADRAATALNGSGAAPFGARLADFAGGIPLRGLRAATVPGQVHAWLTAHRRWGRLPLERVLAPAIRCADEGFEVWPRLVATIEQAADCHDQPGFRGQFMPDGHVPRAGSRLRQPNIAEALRQIARDGERAYYEGPTADALVRLSREQGGWFEPQDLAAHRSYIQQPLAYDYNGYTILEQPAPSQGVIVLQCLALAKRLRLCDRPFDDPQRVHLMIEILKAAYADRFRFWADPAFTRLPVEKMLSDDYIADRAALIDPDHARDYEPGDLAIGRDTTYLAACDAAGNAVSYIQSVFHGFGCGVVEPTFGVLLNNRMNGFTLEKGHPNAIYPGKRPVHTLNTYMVLKDGRLLYVGGTPGGPNQVQWNFQVLSALLDHDVAPQVAVAAPRWSWAETGTIQIESDYGPDVLAGLEARGHRLAVVPPRLVGGRVQLIRIRSADGTAEGVCDPRIAGAVLSPGQPG